MPRHYDKMKEYGKMETPPQVANKVGNQVDMLEQRILTLREAIDTLETELLSVYRRLFGQEADRPDYD